MSHFTTQVSKWIVFLFIAATLVGCGPATTAPQLDPTLPASTVAPQVAPATEGASSQMANPASSNCVKQGGSLVIQKRGDGGEYGVCFFEDNRQCEEWALMRGDCPVGGFKVTGFLTEAAQYCAITGGQYTPTTGNGTDEQGTCSFHNGKQCDAKEYFDGKCDPKANASSYSDPFAYCAAVGDIDAPDANYTGEAMPDSILQAMIQKGIVTADAPKDFQQHAVWRCMDKKVWACHFGANIPCTEKADLSQTPAAGMEEYCKANPNAENMPASAAGRTTIYEWKCKDAKPELVKPVLTVDSRGFIAAYWYELTAP
jgi:putative hemolysin